jgi:hypothetical protein
MASAIAFQSSDLTKGNFVRIHHNNLASNGAILQFGGNDGESAKGLLLEFNTFRRLSNPTPTGKPFIYGYWVGQELNNIMAGNIPETSNVDPALASNIQFEGSGPKNLTIGRHRLEVQVRGGDGTLPFPGATITLKDKNGNSLVQNMSDPTGTLILYSPQVYYSGTGTSISRAEYSEGDMFSVTASVPNAPPQIVPVSMSEAKVISIVFPGVIPPTNTAPERPKNLKINR